VYQDLSFDNFTNLDARMRYNKHHATRTGSNGSVLESLQQDK